MSRFIKLGLTKLVNPKSRYMDLVKLFIVSSSSYRHVPEPVLPLRPCAAASVSMLEPAPNTFRASSVVVPAHVFTDDCFVSEGRWLFCQ